MLAAILSALVISLISFFGVFALFFSDAFVKKIIFFLIALSAGTLMGGAFLHLIPEAIEKLNHSHQIFLLVLVGFSIFFLLEKIFFWRHCHSEKKCEIHPVGYLNLIGDGLHNFFDGVLLFFAFSTDFHFGLTTTFAIAMHEIPQEIGDFGVLLHAGFSKVKALFWNFVSGIFAVVGVFAGLVLEKNFEKIAPFFIAFSAGGFLYISASDLIPILHREKNLQKSLASFFIFILGIILINFSAH